MIKHDDLHGLPELLWMAAERAVSDREGDMRRHRVGCVIARCDGALVSARNGTSRAHRMPSGHAEARCARKADKNSTAYVARVRKDGTIGMARPCKSCQVRLKSRGVQVVFYTAGPNKWGGLNLHSGVDMVHDESEHRPCDV